MIKLLTNFTMIAIVLGLGLSGCGGGSGSDGGTPPAADDEPKVSIAPNLQPTASIVSFIDGTGARPVASMSDDNGSKTDFVENEIIVALDNPDEITALASRLNATVERTINPATSDLPHFFLLKTTPSETTAEELQEIIKKSGTKNNAKLNLSSQNALNLLAEIGREPKSSGTQLSANFLLEFDSLDERVANESPTAMGGTGYSQNAFDWPYMNRGSVQDIGAAEAARMIRAAGKLPSLEDKELFVVLDAGFSSTADYPTPLLPPGSALDIPSPLPNPDVRWHGTKVTSTAMSVFDNGIGGAGPASQVAIPVAIQSPNANMWDILEYAFVALPLTAAHQPSIINISASADIPAGACFSGACFALDSIGHMFRSAGILFFSSAGNEHIDVDAEDCLFDSCWERAYRVPCEIPGVVCVGGLQHNSASKHANSAFGSKQRTSAGSVDIYGPYSVWVHDDPDGGTTNAKFVHGTSYASPFVASIAALAKAANPDLGAGDLENLLKETAHTSDSVEVHQWVNAYQAVKTALGGNAPPFANISEPGNGRNYTWSATETELNAICSVEDDSPSTTVVWTSSIDGVLGNSAVLGLVDLSDGNHDLTCSISDGEYTVADTVSINIVNSAPTVQITNPEMPAVFFAAQPIPLSATINDLNNNLASVEWRILLGTSIIWNSSNQSATVPGGTFAPGSYLLELTATDSLGLLAQDSVTLTINANPENLPPTILNPQIQAIPSGDPNDTPPSSFFIGDENCPIDVSPGFPENGFCQTLEFSATVTDDHDAPSTLVSRWQVFRDETLLRTNFTTIAEQRFYFDLSGTYTVRLQVEDTAGNTSPPFSWSFSIERLI